MHVTCLSTQCLVESGVLEIYNISPPQEIYLGQRPAVKQSANI